PCPCSFAQPPSEVIAKASSRGTSRKELQRYQARRPERSHAGVVLWATSGLERRRIHLPPSSSTNGRTRPSERLPQDGHAFACLPPAEATKRPLSARGAHAARRAAGRGRS